MDVRKRVLIDDPFICGVLFNVSLSDSRFHILEAIMEGTALNIKRAQIYFEKPLEGRISKLFTEECGGLWDSLCRIIADSTRAEVWRINTPREASVIGAIVLGRGEALGLADFDYVKPISKTVKMFKPRSKF